MSYNLSGVKSGLKLDGTTIANIFLGKIKTWNDPAIKSLNPGMTLPSTAITVVHRSDSSGTTHGFTTFLSDVDPALEVAGRRGQGRQVADRDRRAKNSGVAAAVKQTAGAIGYVEQAYALENGFTYAAVKNSGGQFILPTIPNTSAAAQGSRFPPDLGISTINSTASGAYPIVSQTFIEAYKDPCKDGGASTSVAAGLKKFLTYAFGAGQQTLGAGANQLPYAPLPASLAAKDNKQLATMTCNGAPSRKEGRVEASATTVRGGRSVLERSPLSRLPDRVLKWGLTTLAALILALLAYFFIRLIGQSTRSCASSA